MNPNGQSELHPGNDLLSAFAERALPEGERARILAHMAGCARCREVVYLAQAAADADIVPAAVKNATARPGRIAAAFGKWRVALVPAAALAAVGGIVLWVQMHPAPQITQTAQIGPPLPPPSGPATARMAPSMPPSAEPTPGVSAPPIAASAAKRAKPESNGANAVVLGPTDGEQLNAYKPPPPVPVLDQGGYSGVHLDGHSASMARYAPPPPQPVRPNAWVSRSPQSGPQWQNNQQMVEAAPELNDKATNLASQSSPSPNLLAASAGTLEPAQILQSSQQLERTSPSTNSFALMQLARRARLPSGLNAVSSAALLNRLVVVDSAGSVFLSQDAGKHWETVAAQWSGKAIEVQAPPEPQFMRAIALPGREAAASAPAPASTPAETASAPASPAPAPAPVSGSVLAASNAKSNSKSSPLIQPMLFTLVTDRHQTWVSTDGRVWREPHVAAPPPGTP